MISKEVVLTYEGLKKLEEELDYLKRVKRREVAERIKQALGFGDISENSEYDEAKNEQAQLEARIAQLESMLKKAKVLDDDEISTDRVGLGTKVKLFDLEFKEEVEYSIVGSTEADPSQSKISNESPVGKALMGRKTGDIIDVIVPDGVIRFEILDIYK
ncbi:MAG TPA: transcription elongation factor GreA [Clostridiaceae bacterium]|jgi:transcription elongation factor GreA|nr:transcription elongation factor GreA [Clostridiaceae bacterium]